MATPKKVSVPKDVSVEASEAKEAIGRIVPKQKEPLPERRVDFWHEFEREYGVLAVCGLSAIVFLLFLLALIRILRRRKYRRNLRLLDEYIENGQFYEAEEYYKELSEKYPDDPQLAERYPLIISGIQQQKDKDLENRLQHLDALIYSGQFQEAYDDYLALKEKYPDDPSVVKRFAVIKKGLQEERKKEFTQQLVQMDIHLESGQFREAFNVYSDLRELYKKNPELTKRYPILKEGLEEKYLEKKALGDTEGKKRYEEIIVSLDRDASIIHEISDFTDQTPLSDEEPQDPQATVLLEVGDIEAIKEKSREDDT
jgi:tetratricopeptide (TPR) repeat protein